MVAILPNQHFKSFYVVCIFPVVLLIESKACEFSSILAIVFVRILTAVGL